MVCLQAVFRTLTPAVLGCTVPAIRPTAAAAAAAALGVLFLSATAVYMQRTTHGSCDRGFIVGVHTTPCQRTNRQRWSARVDLEDAAGASLGCRGDDVATHHRHRRVCCSSRRVVCRAADSGFVQSFCTAIQTTAGL